MLPRGYTSKPLNEKRAVGGGPFRVRNGARNAVTRLPLILLSGYSRDPEFGSHQFTTEAYIVTSQTDKKKR